MLGSRFDLMEEVGMIAERNAAPVKDRIVSSSSDIDAECVELEREIIKVAASIHSSNARVNFACPICDERMNLTEVKDLSEFGSLDVKLHKLACTACGMSTGRAFHPTVGYRNLVR